MLCSDMNRQARPEHVERRWGRQAGEPLARLIRERRNQLVPVLVRAAVSELQRRLSPTGPQLSPREREVLGLLAEGLGVAAISKQLFISESTTKTHISKVYEKLGAGNRAQALMTAMRLGLIANPADQHR